MPWATIVGVVGHVSKTDLAGEDVKGKYYFSLYQSPQPVATLIARTPRSRAAGRAIREAVRAWIDAAGFANQVAARYGRQFARAAPLCGDRAGSLRRHGAADGRDRAIRRHQLRRDAADAGNGSADGAGRRAAEILRMVLGQGMRLACGGAAIGLVVSLISSRLLRNQLFHVSSFDPLTFALMAAVLIGAALAASYIPARRATRVDPMVALRHE